MKRLVLTLVALLVPVALGAQGITGSAHDFSGDGWAGGQICVVCHTPHNADQTVAASPLWNHTVTGSTFTTYSSATLDATTLGQPDGASKLCLSCHDGTVAIDDYGGGSAAAGTISGSDNLGTDLGDDHPISFTYDATLAVADGGLHDPTTITSGLGGTITADMLFAGSMECASCHDVHDAAGIEKLLVKSNAASALCMTCHNK